MKTHYTVMVSTLAGIAIGAASVARMKCNEIRGTEPPRFRCARSRLRHLLSMLFLADAGWLSGNKTHRPELRTPLASWQGMAREAHRDWLVAWVCLHH